MLLHQIFQSVKKDYPQRPALKVGIRTFSYLELDLLTDKLAQQLRLQGIVSQDRVGVYYPRSEWQVCFMLALSKIGAVYVPFMHRTGEPVLNEQHQEQIQDCKLKKLFTSRECLAAVELVFKDKDNLVVDLELGEVPLVSPVAIEDTEIAYIMYSSGTSGKPKGIPIMHAGLKPWFDQLRTVIGVSEGNRVAIQVQNGFDAHIWEYLMAWSCGGCAYVASDATIANPHELKLFIEKNHIHDLTLTPTVLSMLLEGRDALSNLGLKRVYVTGEEVNADLVRAITAKGIRLYNCYGPTELTFGYSMLEITIQDIDAQTQAVAIGAKSHDKVTAYIKVVDENKTEYISLEESILRREPVKGELLVESPYMTPGYLGHSLKNSPAFQMLDVKNKQILVYGTGDNVVCQNGKVYYNGRNSALIKNKTHWINTSDVARKIQEQMVSGHVIVFQVAILNNKYLVAITHHSEESTRALKNKVKEKFAKSQEIPNCIYNIKELNLATDVFDLQKGKTNQLAIQAATRKLLNDKIDEKTSPEQIRKKIADLLGDNKLEITQTQKVIEEIVTGWIATIIGDFDLDYLACAHLKLADLSMTSLDIMRLHTHISTYFNQSLLADDFRNKTIAELIGALIDPFILRSCFVSRGHAQNGAGNAVIYCMPPITGSISDYRALSFPGVDMKIFESPLLNEELNSELFSRFKNQYCKMAMDDLAEKLAIAIRQLQPSGEINLMGWSFGGDLAWAVASKLCSQFRKVKQLVLLDPQAPLELAMMQKSELHDRLTRLTKKIVELVSTHFQSKVLGIDHAAATNALVELLLTETDQQQDFTIDQFYATIDKNLQKLKEDKKSVHPDVVYRLEPMFATTRAHVNMLYHWKPDPWGVHWPVKTALFIANEGIDRKLECRRDLWEKYIGPQAEILAIEKNHFKIMESDLVIRKYKEWFAAHQVEDEAFNHALKSHYGKTNSFVSAVSGKTIPIENAMRTKLLDGQLNQTPLGFDRLVEEGTRTLIMGGSGSGKTSMCLRASHAWAHNQIWPEYQTVILIHLESLQKYKARLEYQDDVTETARFVAWTMANERKVNLENSEETLVRLIQSKSKQILWILDGFDEIELSLRDHKKNQIFQCLIKQPTVLLTSRINVSNYESTARYILFGLFEKDVRNFVRLMMSYTNKINAHEMADQFVDQLKMHSEFWELAQTPFNLEMLVSSVSIDELKNANTMTLTTLLKKFSLSLFKRYLSREPWNLNNLSEVDVDESTPQISRYFSTLAWQGIERNQQEFSQKDLEELLNKESHFFRNELSTYLNHLQELKEFRPRHKYLTSEIMNAITQTGLLSIPASVDNGFYRFSHKSMQEYFAAKYLVSQKDNQVQIAAFFAADSHLNILKYLIGLLSDDAERTQVIFDEIDNCFNPADADSNLPNYEIHPELFIRLVSLFEQTKDFQLRQSEQIFQTIRRFVAIALINQAEYSEWNARYRLDMISTLRASPRVMHKSGLKAYLREMAEDYDTESPERYTDLLRQVESHDYTSCLIDGSLSANVPRIMRQNAVANLMTLLSTDKKAEQYVISQLLNARDNYNYAILISELNANPGCRDRIARILASIVNDDSDDYKRLQALCSLKKLQHSIKIDIKTETGIYLRLLNNDDEYIRHKTAESVVLIDPKAITGQFEGALYQALKLNLISSTLQIRSMAEALILQLSSQMQLDSLKALVVTLGKTVHTGMPNQLALNIRIATALNQCANDVVMVYSVMNTEQLVRIAHDVFMLNLHDSDLIRRQQALDLLLAVPEMIKPSLDLKSILVCLSQEESILALHKFKKYFYDAVDMKRLENLELFMNYNDVMREIVQPWQKIRFLKNCHTAFFELLNEVQQMKIRSHLENDANHQIKNLVKVLFEQSSYKRNTLSDEYKQLIKQTGVIALLKNASTRVRIATVAYLKESPELMDLDVTTELRRMLKREYDPELLSVIMSVLPFSSQYYYLDSFNQDEVSYVIAGSGTKVTLNLTSDQTQKIIDIVKKENLEKTNPQLMHSAAYWCLLRNVEVDLAIQKLRNIVLNSANVEQTKPSPVWMQSLIILCVFEGVNQSVLDSILDRLIFHFDNSKGPLILTQFIARFIIDLADHLNISDDTREFKQWVAGYPDLIELYKTKRFSGVLGQFTPSNHPNKTVKYAFEEYALYVQGFNGLTAIENLRNREASRLKTTDLRLTFWGKHSSTPFAWLSQKINDIEFNWQDLDTCLKLMIGYIGDNIVKYPALSALLLRLQRYPSNSVRGAALLELSRLKHFSMKTFEMLLCSNMDAVVAKDEEDLYSKIFISILKKEPNLTHAVVGLFLKYIQRSSATQLNYLLILRLLYILRDFPENAVNDADMKEILRGLIRDDISIIKTAAMGFVVDKKWFDGTFDDLFIVQVSDVRAEVRNSAIGALAASINHDARLEQKIVDRVGVVSKEYQMRLLGDIESLTQLAGRKRLLLTGILDKESPVRVAAIRSLCKCLPADTDAIDMILSRLEDDAEWVVNNAIMALIDMKCRRASFIEFIRRIDKSKLTNILEENVCVKVLIGTLDVLADVHSETNQFPQSIFEEYVTILIPYFADHTSFLALLDKSGLMCNALLNHYCQEIESSNDPNVVCFNYSVLSDFYEILNKHEPVRVSQLREKIYQIVFDYQKLPVKKCTTHNYSLLIAAAARFKLRRLAFWELLMKCTESTNTTLVQTAVSILEEISFDHPDTIDRYMKLCLSSDLAVSRYAMCSLFKARYPVNYDMEAFMKFFRSIQGEMNVQYRIQLFNAIETSEKLNHPVIRAGVLELVYSSLAHTHFDLQQAAISLLVRSDLVNETNLSRVLPVILQACHQSILSQVILTFVTRYPDLYRQIVSEQTPDQYLVTAPAPT